jgi:hypothetical protein
MPFPTIPPAPARSLRDLGIKPSMIRPAVALAFSKERAGSCRAGRSLGGVRSGLLSLSLRKGFDTFDARAFIGFVGHGDFVGEAVRSWDLYVLDMGNLRLDRRPDAVAGVENEDGSLGRTERGSVHLKRLKAL